MGHVVPAGLGETSQWTPVSWTGGHPSNIHCQQAEGRVSVRQTEEDIVDVGGPLWWTCEFVRKCGPVGSSFLCSDVPTFLPQLPPLLWIWRPLVVTSGTTGLTAVTGRSRWRWFRTSSLPGQGPGVPPEVRTEGQRRQTVSFHVPARWKPDQS